MKRTLLVAIGLSFAGATHCGSDDASAAESACLSLADAFARAWDRCDRLPLEDAQDLFRENFGCGDATDYDRDKVDPCVAALEAMSCNAVESNVTPSECAAAVDTN